MGTKAAAALSIENDMNDGMAEIELQKLQRQYRIMEGDRKAYSEESRLLIGKQRASIEKLRVDNEHLQDELRLLEQRNEDRRKNGIQSKKAEAMAEQADLLQKRIRQILEEIANLDKETARIAHEVDIHRAKLGGVNAAQINNAAIDKQVRVLENRLEKALIKFNKALAVNKKLRGVIDNLRRERLVFDNIYHKFEKELMEQKKQMADIIETSNAAYEARDEAQSKIIVLREKAEKEYQSYIQEMKELDRILEQDRRLKEFMATKAANRTEKFDNKNKQSNGKKDILGNNKFPSQEQLYIPLNTYESVFSEIRKVTGISDIGELVQRFTAVEDQNFSLFNYVNEINNEIELHAEEIVELQSKLNAMKVEAVAVEEERKKTLKQLEHSLKTTNEKCQHYDKQYNEISVILSDLTKGVESIISVLQQIARQRPASAAPQKELGEEETEGERPVHTPSAMKRSEKVRAMIDFPLPTDSLGPQGVTESNLIQFLGLIEQKANDLLTLNYLVNSPKKAVQLTGDQEGLQIMPAGGVAGLLGQGPTAHVGNITIVAPSTLDDHDSGDNASDEDDRPLTREELKQRTLRGLIKREKTANAQNKLTVTKSKRKVGQKKE
ncbi:Coiled-coil domain-containing protein 63 [Boothiomyces macroporosus]|uniref:Coiled-coil domain-containing protein 63 n=1 Tax=Boothiomyces macroporosus TaxID=261099 RepID=A0AAD5Y2C6_9FUNG|nr:Coiled-coil domain-containing protein 63 [Boothiomyces macroporosus]